MAIIATDRDGNITESNRCAQAMFGYQEQELLGKPIHLLLPPHFRQRHAELLAAFVQGDEQERKMGSRSDVVGYRKDGTFFPLEASIAKFRDGDDWLLVVTLRDITESHVAQIQVQEQANQLKAHFDEQQREAELARRILDHQIRTDLMAEAGVEYSVIPASNFSGDMVLAARSPSGRLYAILADATGHGLSAAVSVLPMVQEFYRLVELSTPLSTLVESINFLLANSLPLGRFVAAAFVVLDQREGQGEIWVGGVPDVLLFGEDGRLQRRFGSSSLPLGILKTTEIAHAIEHFTWQSAGQLMLVSDGIVEASNAEDVAFGEARLIETLESRAPGLAMSEALQQSLQAYLGGSVAHDDMSMLVIDCPRAGSIA